MFSDVNLHKSNIMYIVQNNSLQVCKFASAHNYFQTYLSTIALHQARSSLGKIAAIFTECKLGISLHLASGVKMSYLENNAHVGVF